MLDVRVDAFAYPGQQTLLRDVSFSLALGEILAVLGPNGVGKSTLIQCMLGLLRCAQGQSLLDGDELRALPPRRLWRQVGYVPQARQAVGSMLIEDMVLMGRSAHVGFMRQPSAEDSAAVEEIMESLGITHLRGSACHQVSGGELQMAYMARALAAKPRLLVLDEPESGLDYHNQGMILQTLTRLAALGIASVWITHFPQNALRVADRALLLFPSGDTAFGPTKETITQERLCAAYDARIAVGETVVEERRYPVIVALDP